MAERGVHGLQRILGAPVGLRLAEADVGQLALDRVDQSGIHLRRWRRRVRLPAGVVGNRHEVGVLGLQMPQDVLQRVLDPAEIACAAALLGRGLDALQQVRHALLEMRTQLNAGGQVKVSVNDLVVKAVAGAFVDVPEANRTWSDEGMVIHDSVDIGIAVSLDDGLVVPVVRGVEGLSVSALGGRIAELAGRGREGRLKLEPWLAPRIDHPNVTLHPRTRLTGADSRAAGIAVALDGGKVLTVDQVVLATGYKVDLARVPFLASGLRARLQVRDGFPVLDEHFETSIPGLYVTSLAATHDFGSFLAFTVSVRAQAKVIARDLAEPARVRPAGCSAKTNSFKGLPDRAISGR